MHGNVCEWCQESYKNYPPSEGDKAIEDKEDVLRVIPAVARVMRGGSFVHFPDALRSGIRYSSISTNRNDDYGFRPARTIAP
jgi:formylglycine-generating enzyme required for sulfatase activity